MGNNILTLVKDAVTDVSGEHSLQEGSGRDFMRAEAIAALSRCSTREARAVMSYDTALRMRVLPLAIYSYLGEEVLHAAAAVTDDHELLRTLQFAAGLRVKLVRVDRDLLAEAIFSAYHGDEALLAKRLQDATDCREDAAVPSGMFENSAGDAADFLAALIRYAAAEGASDLHIYPTVEGPCIKMRVLGELKVRHEPIGSAALHKNIIQRLKVLAKLDTTNRSLPQDGSFMMQIGDRSTPVRTSIMPTIHGEKAVLRFIARSNLLNLTGLRFNTKSENFLRRFLGHGRGAALFAGPTGSGKTTTMYAALQELSARSLNIVTIEDPVEVIFGGASQTCIDERRGLTYSVCLKSMLRQDPDVILLGEMRDSESAEAALQAALTGHTLLSTVHARNVFEICLRLRSLGVDSLTMVQGVELLICQRLLPQLCSNCKVVDLSNSNQLSFEVFKPVGCRVCDWSGFSGRVAAAEVLLLHDELRDKLMRERDALDRMVQLVDDSCYSSLSSAVTEHLRSGNISVQDAE